MLIYHVIVTQDMLIKDTLMKTHFLIIALYYSENIQLIARDQRCFIIILYAYDEYREYAKIYNCFTRLSAN